ncbi:MAG TPA: hypothetical protein PKO15_07915 [Fibrobacteria bacterium]|nr:hypothetical protein [Fibrobacteria bacterium]HOX50825.1 hypothetical protein [Fibrobacteria bacterium]
MNENLHPDPRLERHLLGETPDHLAKSTRKALEDPQAQARLAELQQSNEAILAALPPDRMAEAIRRRASERPARQRGWMPGLAFAGLALGVSLAVFHLLGSPSTQDSIAKSGPGPDTARTTVHDSGRTESIATAPDSTNVPDPSRSGRTSTAHAAATDTAQTIDTASWEVAMVDDDILLKGASHRLAIHRIATSSTEAVRLSDLDSARSGDLLQVGTLAGPKRYVAILSLDGNGQVTRHLPETGDSGLRVDSKLQAPHSYRLDDAPRFERFVLVESRRAFEIAPVEGLLKKAGAHGLLTARGLRIESILLHKQP